MPIHHRIPGIIGQAISKYGPAGSKILQSDKLVLNQAWRGFKHKSSIVSGIRTGLTTGGIVGSFINTGDEPPNVYGPNVYAPNQQDQTRNRRGRGSYSRYSKQYSRNHKCRCTNSRKYNRRSNRFRSPRFLSPRRGKSYRPYR